MPRPEILCVHMILGQHRLKRLQRTALSQQLACTKSVLLMRHYWLLIICWIVYGCLFESLFCGFSVVFHLAQQMFVGVLQNQSLQAASGYTIHPNRMKSNRTDKHARHIVHRLDCECACVGDCVFVATTIFPEETNVNSKCACVSIGFELDNCLDLPLGFTVVVVTNKFSCFNPLHPNFQYGLLRVGALTMLVSALPGKRDVVNAGNNFGQALNIRNNVPNPVSGCLYFYMNSRRKGGLSFRGKKASHTVYHCCGRNSGISAQFAF